MFCCCCCCGGTIKESVYRRLRHVSALGQRQASQVGCVSLEGLEAPPVNVL